METAFKGMGYKVQVHELSDYHDDYGLEGVDDDGDDEQGVDEDGEGGDGIDDSDDGSEGSYDSEDSD